MNVQMYLKVLNFQLFLKEKNENYFVFPQL